MHRGVGQRRGSGGGDALAKGDNPGQRALAVPADLRALDGGAAAGPGGVHRLEGEQAFGELLFENGEGFGGAGRGGGFSRGIGYVGAL